MGIQTAITREPKSTKAQLIKVAARLFGIHGFDGISMREIAADAGQRNFNAVQYHFGSKRGLINAVLEAHYWEADRLRSDIIANRHGSLDLSELSTRELLKLLWEPAYLLSAHDGSATYCRFHLQYRLNPAVADHPLYAAGRDYVPYEKVDHEGEMPSMYSVVRALRAKFSQFDDLSFHKHTAAIDYMFLCSVVEEDNRRAHGEMGGLEIDFETILDMMSAAMSARLGQ